MKMLYGLTNCTQLLQIDMMYKRNTDQGKVWGNQQQAMCKCLYVIGLKSHRML